MSRYYGTMNSNKRQKEATCDALTYSHACGWTSGIKVVPDWTAPHGQDTFGVWLTGGSKSVAATSLLGTLRNGSNGPVWEPADKPAEAEAAEAEVARRIARTMAPPAPDVTMNNGYIVRAVMPGHPAEPGLLESWWVACQESEDSIQWVTWEAYALDGDRAGQLAYNAGQYFYSTDPAANKQRALANLAVRAGIS